MPSQHEPDSLRKTADLLFSQEKYEAAANAYLKLTEYYPNDFEAWFKRGKAMYLAEKYGDAVASCERSLAINPDNPETLQLLAECFDKTGNFEKQGLCIIRLTEL